MTTTPPPGDPQGRDDVPGEMPPGDAPSLTAPTPPPGVLDAARAAALAAFDEQHPSAGDPTAEDAVAGAPVGDLAAARERRWYQRVPLGAAAAVIAAIAIVGTLSQIDTGGDDDLATAALDDSAEVEDSGDAGAGADGGSLESPEAAFDADSSISGDARAEEGAASLDAAASYDDLDAFLAVVADRDPTAPAGTVPAPSTTTSQSGSEPSGDSDDGEAPCDAVTTAGVDGVVAVEVAFVEDLGVTVAAVVYESATGVRVTSVDLASCAVLDDRAL